MSKTAIKAVFFDLGDTLGTAEVGGVPRRLLRFDLFPFSLGLLSELKARELKLGVISNTGSEKADTVNRVLEPTGILADLDPNLLLYSGEEGVTKASPEIFSRAARMAELEGTPDHCLFVGEDSSERSVALSAGWRVCPHPLLVKGMISEQSLFLHNAFAHSEVTMPISREFDIRRRRSEPRTFAPESLASASEGGVNALTGTPKRVRAEGASPTDKSLIERAFNFVNRNNGSFGFSGQQTAEFVPDPTIQRTSAGSASVNLSQQYRGLPVFQMSRIVRFDPDGGIADAAGDTALIQDGLSVEPKFASVTHALARKVAWEAFAHFGMGLNAMSFDADRVDDIVPGRTLPDDI